MNMLVYPPPLFIIDLATPLNMQHFSLLKQQWMLFSLSVFACYGLVQIKFQTLIITEIIFKKMNLKLICHILAIIIVQGKGTDLAICPGNITDC